MKDLPFFGGPHIDMIEHGWCLRRSSRAFPSRCISSSSFSGNLRSSWAPVIVWCCKQSLTRVNHGETYFLFLVVLMLNYHYSFVQNKIYYEIVILYLRLYVWACFCLRSYHIGLMTRITLHIACVTDQWMLQILCYGIYRCPYFVCRAVKIKPRSNLQIMLCMYDLLYKPASCACDQNGRQLDFLKSVEN